MANMARLMLCAVLIGVVSGAAHKLNHKLFTRGPQEYGIHDNSPPTQVTCNADLATQRDALLAKSACGEPKDVFIYFDHKTISEQVSPEAVWVKRCVGLCDHAAGGSCGPAEVETRNIAVRIYNAHTQKESCATFPIEFHKSCRCCALSGDKCPAPRMFNSQEPTYEVESI